MRPRDDLLHKYQYLLDQYGSDDESLPEADINEDISDEIEIEPVQSVSSSKLGKRKSNKISDLGILTI